MLVLVIGDVHIPHRAFALPAKFQKLLVPNKMQHVLCTGNLCSNEVYDYLRSLTGDVHVVKGDFDGGDEYLSKAPETKIVTIGIFRIGLCHGHQHVPWNNQNTLEMIARQLDVDVLITGHTHRIAVKQVNGKLFLNPGSATGAFTSIPGEGEVVPSFILLDVQTESITVYSYRLIDDQVKVERLIYKKSQQ